MDGIGIAMPYVKPNKVVIRLSWKSAAAGVILVLRNPPGEMTELAGIFDELVARINFRHYVTPDARSCKR